MSEAKRYKLFQDVCYDDGAFVIPAGQVMVREADYNALRDERDRLREALREIYEGRWTPGISCCYEDDARSIYPTREMRIRHIAQAALTPAGGGHDGQ